MKHKENDTFEFIPDGEDEQAWAIRILKGMYTETVIKFGAIRFNEEAQGVMTFNFYIIESPDPDLTVDDEDLQEFAGDVVFLSKDGLRTIAGTEKIGDVELGTISKPVQERFDGVSDVDEFTSVVIPDKTQYRIFFSNANTDRDKTVPYIQNYTDG